MLSELDTSPEQYWIKVGSDQRKHPYAIHKTVNRNDVEVVHSISDDENHPKRWVILRDGTLEAWVRVADQDEYGYEIQPDERLSEAELEVINLKHAAIRDGSSVPVEEARALVESDNTEQIHHALIALYYAAKADSAVPEDDVDILRETMHEHTNHIDTSHSPTLKKVLDETIGDTEQDTTR